MANSLLMPTGEYKPCRVTECFLDKDGEIEVSRNNGVSMFRLKGIGRSIWLMLDGKHTINDIINRLCRELSSTDVETIQKGVISVLDRLVAKKVIIANWHPLYKLQLNQELMIDE